MRPGQPVISGEGRDVITNLEDAMSNTKFFVILIGSLVGVMGAFMFLLPWAVWFISHVIVPYWNWVLT